MNLNVRNALLVDAVAWCVFGTIWMLFPCDFLCANFGEKKYDWVTLHMTEAFGLLCFFTGVFSLMIYQKNDEELSRELLRIKFLLEFVLLGLMILANKNILNQIGMYGLVFCILLNIYSFTN